MQILTRSFFDPRSRGGGGSRGRVLTQNARKYPLLVIFIKAPLAFRTTSAGIEWYYFLMSMQTKKPKHKSQIERSKKIQRLLLIAGSFCRFLINIENYVCAHRRAAPNGGRSSALRARRCVQT